MYGQASAPKGIREQLYVSFTDADLRPEYHQPVNPSRFCTPHQTTEFRIAIRLTDSPGTVHQTLNPGFSKADPGGRRNSR